MKAKQLILEAAGDEDPKDFVMRQKDLLPPAEEYDHLDVLADLTETKPDDWESTDGPDSGVGVDYYYVNKNDEEAWINDDQGYLTIAVDGETIFGGDLAGWTPSEPEPDEDEI